MYSAASIPRDLPAPSVMIRNWSSGRRGEGEGGGGGGDDSARGKTTGRNARAS